MRRPVKLGTTMLSMFLIGSGALPVLHLTSATAYAILHIIAIGAGVLIWPDR